MISKAPHQPRIMQLAAQIEQDIGAKQLQPGDAYLKTSEIARMLGVGTTAANRAMQLLSKRRVLHRRQRTGTVVAEGIVKTHRLPLRCVHLLVHEHYLKTEGLLGDGLMIGMQTALPGVNVQLHFAPAVDDSDDVNRLIAAALRSPEPEGIVLMRASLTVQRLVQACGLPAVVFGMLYPSIHGLAWLDWDNRQTGRLLAEYMLQHGHRRVLYLGRDRMFPGDYPQEDGIRETLAEAAVPVSDLTTRYLPADHETVRAAVGEILKAGSGSLGIIAKTEPLAVGAAAAVEDMGLTIGRDVTIAVARVFRAGNERPVPFPYTRGVLGPQETGARLGEMLLKQVRGRPLMPEHEVIPVELIEGTSCTEEERLENREKA
jgi:DNA-binding LacI/PurR family transcriptional regulator